MFSIRLTLRPVRYLLPLLLLLLPNRLAPAGENAALVLVRSQFGWGGAGENAHIELSVAAVPLYVANAPGSSLTDLYPGYLAPATDRAGLLTRTRVRDMILGRTIPAEPVAVDFAGNRDGRIDSADLVRMTNRLLP